MSGFEPYILTQDALVISPDLKILNLRDAQCIFKGSTFAENAFLAINRFELNAEGIRKAVLYSKDRLLDTWIDNNLKTFQQKSSEDFFSAIGIDSPEALHKEALHSSAIKDKNAFKLLLIQRLDDIFEHAEDFASQATKITDEQYPIPENAARLQQLAQRCQQYDKIEHNFGLKGALKYGGAYLASLKIALPLVASASPLAGTIGTIAVVGAGTASCTYVAYKCIDSQIASSKLESEMKKNAAIPPLKDEKRIVSEFAETIKRSLEPEALELFVEKNPLIIILDDERYLADLNLEKMQNNAKASYQPTKEIFFFSSYLSKDSSIIKHEFGHAQQIMTGMNTQAWVNALDADMKTLKGRSYVYLNLEDPIRIQQYKKSGGDKALALEIATELYGRYSEAMEKTDSASALEKLRGSVPHLTQELESWLQQRHNYTVNLAEERSLQQNVRETAVEDLPENVMEMINNLQFTSSLLSKSATASNAPAKKSRRL